MKFEFNQRPVFTLDLDPSYVPMILGNSAYKKAVNESKNKELVKIAIERSNSQIATLSLYVFNEALHQDEANFIYIERLVKTLLWLKGGWKIIYAGPQKLGKRLSEAYKKGGLRDFDRETMSNIYQKDFVVEIVDFNKVPESNEQSKPLGRHLNGYRIGFDAGGSDRKVSAVVNGESIYSEEVVWFPKTNSNPEYQYNGILDSIKRAASKMPRVDAIGVSAAGIYIDNQVAIASLFLKVSKEDFDKTVRNMFFDIQKEMGNVPLEVANDGDVTALAGSMSLNANKVLGIAMGTSEAVGYVDEKGYITGWLNELAFCPVDYNQDSLIDEWSLDYGVGCKYFSQDAVIKLAKPAGIKLDETLSPAEKLKVVQKLHEDNDPRAIKIFETIGIYLGYTIAYYSEFYDIEHLLILGRVTSGKGGPLIINTAKKVLKQEFPDLYSKINLSLPDEKSRRVGQSIAAASLPAL